MKTSKLTTSPAQTKKYATSMGASLQGGEVLLLIGNLGAGKTTFTQGLLQFFGIDHITSPTFVLKKTYPLKPNKQKIENIHHLDLYRLDREVEFETLDLESCFQPHDITIIEWGEKIRDSLSSHPVMEIKFEITPKHHRRITIKA